MIEALAGIFAAYAGYTGWPWWTAILVGALSGFQVANARLYRGALKDRVAAGDRSVSAKFFQISLIGIIAGAFAGGGIYFATRWVLAA